MTDQRMMGIDTAEVLAIEAEVARRTGSTRYGVTQAGFVPKPFAQLLAEKVALARELFGADVDLTSGSVIRKLLEVSALEDARTWAALAGMYDDQFVVSATGAALSRLGDELGLPRPHEEAVGAVELSLALKLPDGVTKLDIPRGARMTTAGRHHVATDRRVTLSAGTTKLTVPVRAFYPGPEHDLDPTKAGERIDRWNDADLALDEMRAVAKLAGVASLEAVVKVDHKAPLTGGAALWPDARYRSLLLRAPRSLWTVEAVQTSVSLVPGVRRALVRDGWGGLDINQSLFGNFNFAERLFGTERDLGSPYYFTVLVAATEAAIWHGPDGLRAQVAAALEDVRPTGIFPRIEEAEEIAIGIQAKLVVRGLPLPTGTKKAINDSAAAVALKERLLVRVQRYVETLDFGEPVRSSEVIWAIMNEPGIADVQELQLVRYPPSFAQLGSAAAGDLQLFERNANAPVQVNQIAVFVDDPQFLVIA
ncbi:MAG: hypothetical protein U1F43_34120 [Myxococcota bacterium]